MADLQYWFHHGGVSVANLDESVDWYCKVLGFELDRRMHIPQIPADVAFVRNGDISLELFQVPDSKPLPADRRTPDADLQTQGNKHVAFIIKNVEDFGEELKRRGADIVWIRRSPHGANIFIRDNTGNLIEFVEEPLPRGEAAAL